MSTNTNNKNSTKISKNSLKKWKHQGKKASKSEIPPGKKDQLAEANKKAHLKPITQETPPKGLPNASLISQSYTLYDIQVDTPDPGKVQRYYDKFIANLKANRVNKFDPSAKKTQEQDPSCLSYLVSPISIGSVDGTCLWKPCNGVNNTQPLQAST